MFKLKQSWLHKQANTTANNDKIISILQDFAREDFINPFAELSRIKIKAAKLSKELTPNKGKK